LEAVEDSLPEPVGLNNWGVFRQSSSDYRVFVFRYLWNLLVLATSVFYVCSLQRFSVKV